MSFGSRLVIAAKSAGGVQSLGLVLHRQARFGRGGRRSERDQRLTRRSGSAASTRAEALAVCGRADLVAPSGAARPSILAHLVGVGVVLHGARSPPHQRVERLGEGRRRRRSRPPGRGRRPSSSKPGASVDLVRSRAWRTGRTSGRCASAGPRGASRRSPPAGPAASARSAARGRRPLLARSRRTCRTSRPRRPRPP